MSKEKEVKKKGFEAPGTFALVIIFFLWFVLMYIIAWVGLSRIWPVQ
jgi:hypothetical protein